MVNLKSKRLGDVLLLANGIVAVLLINILSSDFFFRIDLTEEKRYSIKEPTREILQNLDDDVYVEVFLEGELNSSFRRFRKAIEETLEVFSAYSNNRIKFVFTDPATAMSEKARAEFMQELSLKGVTPTRVVDPQGNQVTEKIIFPGAVVSYGGFETGVMLLKGNKASTPEEEINQSIEGIEFEFINAIYRLVNTDRKRLGLIRGHDELDSLEIAAFNNAMLEMYDVYQVDLSRKTALTDYHVLLIIKPRKAFSEADKFKLDQYIMQGGRIIFMLDKLEATMDSVSHNDYYAFPYQLNLDDQLFKYGVRLNLDLVQDRMASLSPVVTGQAGGRSRIQMMEWPFFPLINHYTDHPVTRNLDAVLTRFVSSIDTVKAVGVKKTPLLLTSMYSRTLTAPVNVSIDEFRKNVKPEDFNQGPFAIGYLLEGNFTSLYKNRFVPAGIEQISINEESVETKIVVLADGDIARNEINPRTGQPQPLGFDPFSNYTFANQELMMNILAYLTREDGLILARSKEIKLRPLNEEKVRTEKMKWQIINLILPVLAICLYGVIRSIVRKRRFSSFA